MYYGTETFFNLDFNFNLDLEPVKLCRSTITKYGRQQTVHVGHAKSFCLNLILSLYATYFILCHIFIFKSVLIQF